MIKADMKSVEAKRLIIQLNEAISFW